MVIFPNEFAKKFQDSIYGRSSQSFLIPAIPLSKNVSLFHDV